MSWFTKVLSSIRHSGGGRLLHFFNVPTSSGEFDYHRRIGTGQNASVLMAPIQFIQRSMPEAPPIVERRARGSDDEWEPVADHPAAQVLANPNPFYTGIDLLAATVFSYATDGNAYWAVVRNGQRRPVQLWWLPHWLVSPSFPSDGSEFITSYEYRPGGQAQTLEPEDVIHFRHGINPENPRKGISPVGPAIRDLWVDEESGEFVATLLRNGGVPGLVISPDTDEPPSPEDIDEFKRYMRENFGGQQRGSTMVASGKTKVDRIGFNPQEMNLTAATDRSEERVCALLGIPAAVVGFSAGLEQTKVGAPQPLSARLWTPSGPTTMSDIKVGQTVAVPAGWGRVTAVYPQGERDIYRITFQDGSTAESTLDHLWDVKMSNYDERKVLPLAEIASFPAWKMRRTSVPLQGVTEFAEKSTLIPPYVMGLLIADGSFRWNLFFSNTNEEIVEHVAEQVAAGYDINHASRGDYRITYRDHASGRGVGGGSGNTNPFKDELRRLGLWMLYSHEKFVPDLYKYNSSRVRLELLRGILDGDGYVNLHGQPALEQTSEQLADDVTFLVQSLGGYTLKSRKRANRSMRMIQGRSMWSRHDRYHLSIVIEDGARLFYCAEKRNRCRPRTKATSRKFRSIEFVRREQAQCITVDGSLYLTDNFITTHNTMEELRKLAWTNGIIPMQRAFAEELNRGLLPLFRAQGQRPLRIRFDRSEVAALQEDRGQVVTRVDQAVRGGWMTVASAKRAIGQEPEEGDEVYLRPFSTMTVPVGRQPRSRPPAGETGERAAGNGNGKDGAFWFRDRKEAPDPFELRMIAEREQGRPNPAQNAFIRAQEEIEDRLSGAMRGDLVAEVFEELGERAAREARPVLDDELKQAAQNEKITDRVMAAMAMEEITGIFQEVYERHYLRVAEQTAAHMEILGLATDLPDPVARAVIATGGRRAGLVDLNRQTRQSMFNALETGRAEGEGIDQLVRRIRDDIPAGPWSNSEVRARVIARTETKHAQRMSVIENATAQGIDQFIMYDNRTGFDDDECPQIDGLIVSRDEANQLMSLEHPMGTRDCSPHFG